MVDIRDIIGEKSYARLVKAGIADPKKLVRLSEGEIMSLAGIGPKKAKKLLDALKRPVSEKKLNKTYNKLTLRTRFKKLPGQLKKLGEDPIPAIQKIENIREIATQANKFLTNLYNLDRAEKVKARDYAPISLAVSPFTIGLPPRKIDQIGEMRVKQQLDRILIETNYIDPYHNQEVRTITGTVPAMQLTPDIIERTFSLIKEHYNDFRREMPGSLFTIILDQTIPLKDQIQQSYPKASEEKILVVIEGEKQYIRWEKIFRYIQNPFYLGMAKDLDDYRKMYRYLEYKTKKPDTKISFESFKKSPPKGAKYESYFEEAERLGRSIINIGHPTENVWFGLVEAFPDLDLFQFRNVYKQILITGAQTYLLPDVPEAVLELQKEPQLGFGEKDVSQEVMGLINKVFKGKYHVYTKSKDQPIIFTSEQFPDVGFIIV